MIDKETVDKIQQTALITEVVADFITLRKTGSGFKGICPFHDDKNPSLSVSPAKNIFKCFVCGEGGAPVHFVMKHEKLSYPDALKYLAHKYNIEVKETAPNPENLQTKTDRESMIAINQFAVQTFEKNLNHTPEGQAIGMAYFHERGFREDTIKKFQLGYCLNERDSFTQTALNAGYKQELLVKIGLTVTGENDYRADRFRGRVIFPIHSIAGKTVGFGGRIMSDNKANKTAKYINSIDSDVYHKNSELYGIHHARQAIAKHDKCFLVEGYTDVISMHQSGIENTVASCGTALSDNQIKLIKRLTQNITLINDADQAGTNASLKDIPILLKAGFNVRIVVLPEGHDPDSFARKNNASSLEKYIRKNEINFIVFKTKDLFDKTKDDPEMLAKSVTDIADTIALIPNEITRLAYVRECSKVTGYKEDTLIKRITNKRHEINPEETKIITTQPDTRTTETDPVLEPFERSIIHYIVRYGETDMANPPEETQNQTENTPFKQTKKHDPEPKVLTVDFVMNELSNDGLTFTNPLYRRILEETFEHRNDPGFVSEDYFKYHQDPDISSLAAEIIIDKYKESKIHYRSGRILNEKEKLRELVPYVVINFKKAILDEQIRAINDEILKVQTEDDPQLLNDLFRTLKRKNELKGRIAVSLQRVINL
ncbi:MAG: DNA primase [Dysgonamonadaceae bacterium]|jgi:DNA primase|nr:DNA primase [Dysgonamonadaceae bacterium]